VTEGEIERETPVADRLSGDGLLRPEPKTDQAAGPVGFALFSLVFAGLALMVIYVSSPVDLPEFPDCPIQAIGSCGHR
jgi:hypothetical protein